MEIHAWLNCTGFESVPVGDQPILIGRGRAAHFVLPHESVSRKHAVVAVHKGKFRIKNLSAMGFELNGEEVEGTVDLCVGDLVAIGPFVLRIDDHPIREEHQDEDEPTLPFGLKTRREPKPGAADRPTRRAPRPKERPPPRRVGPPQGPGPRARRP
jgi:predicted component of type VI protein secretion system